MLTDLHHFPTSFQSCPPSNQAPSPLALANSRQLRASLPLHGHWEEWVFWKREGAFWTLWSPICKSNPITDTLAVHEVCRRHPDWGCLSLCTVFTVLVLLASVQNQPPAMLWCPSPYTWMHFWDSPKAQTLVSLPLITAELLLGLGPGIW